MPELRREPVFNIPASVLAILAVLIAVHAVRLALPIDDGARLLGWLAFEPIRLTAVFDPDGVMRHVAAWAASDADDGRLAGIAQFFLSETGWGVAPTLLTYALLHGGWTHLGLNGIWLVAFGTPVARRFGAARFLVFFAIAAIAGALTHWALFPFGAEPLIGASAAVSGCMGAAVRFAFRTPRGLEDEGDTRPDESLAATVRDRRALAFLVAWFATNALFGIGAMATGLSDQPVAWQAHIGGFLVGLLFFRVFDRAPSPSPA